MRKLLIVISILLCSSISIAQSITKPASKKFELNVSGQACSGFVLNGFTSTDILLASIGFINPPTGTTFNITTTAGLTPASGFTLTGNKGRLVFTGTMANINAALASLKINTGATAGNVQISVSATLNPTGFFYNPINGHFYRPITTGATYTAAREASLLTTFKGQTGYLVTITSADEDNFIFNNVPQTSIWFALTDEASEARWTIDAGPEKGTLIKINNGQLNGNIPGQYNNWAPGEPNDSGNEDYAVTKWGGGNQWNDLPNNFSCAYVIEYGTWTNPDSQTFTDFYSANVINPIDVPSSKVNFYFGGNINPAQWSVKSYTANGATAVSTTNGLTLGANGSVVNTSDFNKNKTDMVMYLSKLSATTLTNFYWSVLTVGDAYLAFLELADRGLSGTESKAFTNGVQFLNGDIDGNNVFDEKDSYRILRHVIGSETLIVSTWSEDNLFRLIKKSTFDGITKANWATTNVPYKANYPLPVDATINDYVYDIVVALKGDVNMSHTIAQNTQATASTNRSMNLIAPIEISTYVSSKIVDGKVVVSIKVNTLGQLLKGVQLKLNYDSDILKYENTEYITSGNPLNFSNDIGNFINFGSLIYNGTGLLNDNTEYKLIFTPKETITNTIGLTSIEGVDAINVGGSTLKIKNL
jgi:hypothetical protein